jgi:predicted phosphoribosyltransferase
VDSLTVSIIAAAVSVYLDRPYSLVSVEQVSVPLVPHLNVWAVEGRTQIFMSHRVR